MIKGRFIEPTEENVKKYRDEHFNVSFEILKKFNQKVYEGAEDKMPDDKMLRGFVEKEFNPSLMKKHETIVPNTDQDFYDYVKEIRGNDIESKIVVMLDENKKPIGSKIVEVGNENQVWDSEGPMHSMLRYLLSDKRAKYFICVHNHPHTVALFPSTGDLIQAAKEMLVGNLIQIELLDSCIINEFDFYSMVQDEDEKWGKRIFNYEFDDETRKKIRSENFHLYHAIRRAFEGDF